MRNTVLLSLIQMSVFLYLPVDGRNDRWSKYAPVGFGSSGSETRQHLDNTENLFVSERQNRESILLSSAYVQLLKDRFLATSTTEYPVTNTIRDTAQEEYLDYSANEIQDSKESFYDYSINEIDDHGLRPDVLGFKQNPVNSDITSVTDLLLLRNEQMNKGTTKLPNLLNNNMNTDSQTKYQTKKPIVLDIKSDHVMKDDFNENLISEEHSEEEQQWLGYPSAHDLEQQRINLLKLKDEHKSNLTRPMGSAVEVSLHGLIRNSENEPTLTVRAPQYDKECLNPSMRFGCASCHSAITCVGNMAYEMPCDFPTEKCHRDPNFNGGVCLIDPLKECECDCSESGNKPDPYDPASYLTCSCGQETILTTCGPNEEYIEELDTCRLIADSPKCDSLGTFANTNDCRWFYTCLYPSGSATDYHQVFDRCPMANQVYMNSTKTCENVTSLPRNDLCARSAFFVPPPVVSSDSLNLVISSIISSATTTTSSQSQTGVVSNPTSVSTPTTYTCPLIVIFIVFWWPNVINYLCWISS